MNKKLLVVAAADGIKSQYTGVGVVVSFFFEAFEEIKEKLNLGDIDLYAVTPRISVINKNYDNRVADITRAACRANNGKIVEISDLRETESLDELWFGNKDISSFQMWEGVSMSLGSFINGISEHYEEVYVIAHDTIFAKTSYHVLNSNVSLSWVPHSLSSFFRDHKQEERILFEKESIKYIEENGHRIGVISNITRDALIADFAVKDVSLVPFMSGLYLDSYKYKAAAFDQALSIRYNIPMDKKLILSWGRCSYQKGIDIILDAMIEIYTDNTGFFEDHHLVLICPTQTGTEEYVQGIIDRIAKISAHVTFIDTYQETLQFSLLKYPNTEMVILPSRFEGFGLTSIEAKLVGHPDLKIIYTAIPTFKEVFHGSKRAKALETFDGTSLRAIIEESADTDYAAGDGPEDEERYDFVSNHSKGIQQLL